VRARGFTLVEVLVALVIVAAGAAAVLSSLNTAAASSVYLREKTFAQWIAANRIAETRLLTNPPQNGTSEGELDYAGQRWRWRQQITDAAMPGLRRIDVSVRPAVPGAPPTTTSATAADDGGNWTLTLSGVLARDLAAPGTSVDWEPAAQPPPGSGPGTDVSTGTGSSTSSGSGSGTSSGTNPGTGTGTQETTP
jgi:general secretion pathway protein I